MDIYNLIGKDFLGLYAIASLVTFPIAVVIQKRLRTPDDEPKPGIMLSPVEIGFLEGGPARLSEVAFASLVHRNILEIIETPEAKTVAVRRMPLPKGCSKLEKSVYAAAVESHLTNSPGIDTHRAFSNTKRGSHRAMEPIRKKLQDLGLILTEGQETQVRLIPMTVALIPPLILGLPKILIGISRDKPVSLLVSLCILSVILGICLLKVQARTGRGDRWLAQLKSSHQTMSYSLSRGGRLAPEDMSLAFALFGPLVYVGWESATALRKFLWPPTASGSSCGGTLGVGCGGGSCGGGGCGGGCGGCGG